MSENNNRHFLLCCSAAPTSADSFRSDFVYRRFLSEDYGICLFSMDLMIHNKGSSRIRALNVKNHVMKGISAIRLYVYDTPSYSCINISAFMSDGELSSFLKPPLRNDRVNFNRSLFFWFCMRDKKSLCSRWLGTVCQRLTHTHVIVQFVTWRFAVFTIRDEGAAICCLQTHYTVIVTGFKSWSDYWRKLTKTFKESTRMLWKKTGRG